MIKYNLKCEQNHEFEVWFNRGSDYDDQCKRGLVLCPDCGNKKINKAPMAPNIRRSAPKDIKEIAMRIREDIAQNCDDVGDNFADEARAMHYGEKPERSIYGYASAREAKDLTDEGVPVSPLPDILAPKRKKQLN